MISNNNNNKYLLILIILYYDIYIYIYIFFFTVSYFANSPPRQRPLHRLTLSGFLGVILNKPQYLMVLWLV